MGFRKAGKLFAAGAIGLLISGVVAAFGGATANAEVNEIGVDRTVSSRQADSVAGNSTHGDVRVAKPGGVHGQGEIRGSTKAVPDRLRGTRGPAFRGGWPARPSMGKW